MDNSGGKAQAWINLLLLVVLLLSSGCIYLADAKIESINQEREDSYLDHIKKTENATLNTLMYLADIDFGIIDNEHPFVDISFRDYNDTAKGNCSSITTNIPSKTGVGVISFGAKVNESQVGEAITTAKLSTIQTYFEWENFWKIMRYVAFIVQLILIFLALIINILWISQGFRRTNWKDDFREWFSMLNLFNKNKEDNNADEL